MKRKTGGLKEKKITLSRYEVSVVGMLVMTLLPTFGVLLYQIVQDIMTDTTHNFRIYFVTAFVFVTMLVLSGGICWRFAKEISLPSRLCYVGSGIVLLIQLLLLSKCYLNSATVYPCMSGEWFPWHSKTDWKMFVFMTVISVTGILVSAWADRQRKWIEAIRYPAYVLASVLAGGSMYCGNFLASDKLHGNAYYTSVYNALMDAPYDYSNQSIYGHYAILLKYPIKLLGGSYTAFNIVMSIVGGISVFMLALALDICLKNHFISVIGTWAVPIMFFYYPLNHWQMFPHRVLFAGIELYLLSLYFHRKSKWIKPIGYIICSLSLLWNVETGIVCLGVWAAACVCHDSFYGETGATWKLAFACIMKNIMYSVVSVFGMVVIFNLYNMPLGESWHGLCFLLFPHISSWDMADKLIVQAAEQTEAVESSGMIASLKALDSGFASGLSTQFPLQVSPWYFVLLVMGIAVVIPTVRVLYARAQENDYIMGLAAILAMGHLVYFFNRPCFDYLAIAFFEAILIMGILADETEGVDRKGAYIKKTQQLLFVAILTVLSVLSVWQSAFRFAEREALGYYDEEAFEKLVYEIEQTVPENTMAIGQGIQEIYAQLGWDTGCYVVDYSSISGNEHSQATIIVELSKQNECVISVRDKQDDQKVTAQQYMGYMGYDEEAVTIKAHWEFGIDSGAYWDIYYIEMASDFESSLLERWGEVYNRDRSSRRGSE